MTENLEHPSSETSVLERIAKLEGRLDSEEKSPGRKIGQWMGLAALIISITVGGFQIYENIILREREALASDRRALADYVRQITALNSKIISMYISAQTNPAVRSLAKVLYIEKRSIMGLADRLLSERKKLAGFASLFTLSAEHLNVGNTAKARQYAELAVSSATTDADRAEAQRLVARTMFAPGKGQDIPGARNTFGRAVDTIQQIDTFLRADLFANLYSDWIVSEAMFGDCETASELWQSFVNATNDGHNRRPIQDAVKAEISAALTGSKRCSPF